MSEIDLKNVRIFVISLLFLIHLLFSCERNCENQSTNHLLVEMVLRVDYFFIIFFPVYHH